MLTTENKHFTHFYKHFTNIFLRVTHFYKHFFTSYSFLQTFFYELLIFTNIFLRVTHFYKHFFASYSFLQTFFCEFQKYNKYGNTYNDKINTMIFVFLFCL